MYLQAGFFFGNVDITNRLDQTIYTTEYIIDHLQQPNNTPPEI